MQRHVRRVPLDKCASACRWAPPEGLVSRSLGVLFTFGKLRILDLGDLTSDKELQLVCPENKLGKIDIYIVSHHGAITSNSPVFLNAIAPRVAVINREFARKVFGSTKAALGLQSPANHGPG